MYLVIDHQTQQVVAKVANKQAARNKRDRLDLAYGAVRYVVREDAAESSGREMLREFRQLLAD